MIDIHREVSKVENELSRILNRKITVLEEKIGLSIGPIIDDRRDYACDNYSIEIDLRHSFYVPFEHTRQYLPKEKK